MRWTACLSAFGRALDALMLLACLLLLAMTLIIGGRRHRAQCRPRRHRLEQRGLGGHPLSADAAGGALAAAARPAHPRRHPPARRCRQRIGWLLEWAGDLLGLACSLYFVWYGWKVLAASYQAGAISIKTLVTPEWWMLAPLPVAFLLLAIEFVFRMHRLRRARACAARRMRCRRHDGPAHS